MAWTFLWHDLKPTKLDSFKMHETEMKKMNEQKEEKKLKGKEKNNNWQQQQQKQQCKS